MTVNADLDDYKNEMARKSQDMHSKFSMMQPTYQPPGISPFGQWLVDGDSGM
jgi:hypothetical protein